ncbi:sugar 3,4-ketoisomerase [Eilatimonas milleporae]|uniref:WxcM-like protein n=1 Tax=Eilatimonas milleporae TaxID=911205 RepID=A0A3M0CCA5_9PROT|nr:FdtA/QdtA family cupin domain-containing protein [Eilatimonas milleporae]RMB00663.1 WxcM-like protein [Eilatimonas milleporae]
MGSPLDHCRIINLPVVTDVHGKLTFIEENRHIPFDIKRVYYLYDVPGGAVRGAHAHKALQQLYICLSGSCDIKLTDGFKDKTFHLNRSYMGLLLSPMVWRSVDNFSSNSVLLVLASQLYDEDDYYRDYNDYLRGRGILDGPAETG